MSSSRKGERAPIVGAQPTPAQARGRAAEEIAATYLGSQGLRLLERNVHCRGGEVDLIGLDGDTLVFIEVRLRGNSRFGGAAESITPVKQRRVILAAQYWLQGAGRKHAHRACRFDAVLLETLTPPAPIWLRAAFDAS